MSKPPAKKKPHKAAEGCEVGDHVFAEHPKHGAMAVKILSKGLDGFHGGDDAGAKHQLAWDTVRGHKARKLGQYKVVDRGADGALIEDEKGNRRYLAGEIPEPEAAPAAPAVDDPLTGGLSRLSKASSMKLPDGPMLFLKAGTVANRPGLALVKLTDKAGHTTQRWKRTTKDEPKERREPRLDPASNLEKRAAPDVRANPADRWKTSDPKAAAGGKPKAEPRALLPAKGNAPLQPRETPEEAKAKFAGLRQQIRQDRQDGHAMVERGRQAMAGKPAESTPPLSDEDKRKVMEGDVPAPKTLSAEGQAVEKLSDQPKMEPAPAFKNNGVEVDPEKAKLQGGRKVAEPMKHGDTVSFRHGDVVGSGKIVGSGKDGVTVHDGEREHQVRHDALEGKAAPAKPDYAPREAGETDKAYAKRAIDTMDHPGDMPEDHDRYFNDVAGSETVPMDQLVSSKSDEENAQGGANSPKRLAAAYHGQLSKRDPISVSKMPDGKYKIEDGNGTYTGAKALGWKSLKVQVVPPGSGEGAAGPQPPKPLFDKAELEHLPAKAKQPIADRDELYKASGEALTHLKGWLDQGKGVCSQMGYETMKCSPEEADLSKPGGMLFIAPLKGQARAAEKVANDYGGDWSMLKDSVRCSIAVDTMDDLSDALEQLKKSGMILAQQPKDRFAKPTAEGYRDLMLNVKFPNGLIGEVQLHLKSMLKAKEAGHKPYETMRTLDGKPREQWSEEDGAKWQAAFDQSKEIYDSAWSASATKPAAGSGETAMSKALSAQKYEFYDREGAVFRRPAGQPGGVTDVLHGQEWKPYAGDRTAAYLEGDQIEDPMGGGGHDAGGSALSKALSGARRIVLLLKKPAA